MAAQYTEITLEEMEKFLKRAFRILRPKQDQQRGEIFYDLKLGPFVGIRVWTSIRPTSGVGAGVGADAIRVQFVSLKDQGPLEKGKAPIVKRTQGWKDSLKDRIEDLIEKYEDNEEFWENWAGTRSRKEEPEQVMQRQEEVEKPKFTPTPRPEYQRAVPIERLKGDISEKQVGFIRSLLRSVDHREWNNLKLDDITGFDHIPTQEEIRTLSKRQGSLIIDTLLKAGYGKQPSGYGRRYAEDLESDA
jgi:predicted CopG family antitoxin